VSGDNPDAIALPESLHAEVVQAAKERGVSLELFVSEALQRYMDSESPSLVLTESQSETIRKSQQELKEGKGQTTEQVRENLEKKKQEWLQNSTR
jgi:hypothetical protein